ncbi:MAG: hypothetical protein WCO25_02305 [Candidatus Uhrbacteria bacterium]
MGKSKRRDDDDVEARSERQPLPPLDPKKSEAREQRWRDEIARVGRGDRHGGVYYVGNYDHDGNELFGDELAARDARHTRDDDDNLLFRDTND